MKFTIELRLILLVIVTALTITGCHKKTSKQSVVYGRVYVYGTNTPLANHTIYLYGSYGSSGTLFDYKMAETTTDGNGNYRFEYEVVDGVIPRQTWLPGSETESFNETQVFNAPDFSQFNSCYVQGPPPQLLHFGLSHDGSARCRFVPIREIEYVVEESKLF